MYMHYNKMAEIYQTILNVALENKRQLAILIDPDKITILQLSSFINKVNFSIATHIFVGGSSDKHNKTRRMGQS